MRRLLIILMAAFSLFTFCSCSHINIPRSASESEVDSQSEVNQDSRDMEKTNEPQTFTKDFDGIILTLTTDKTEYGMGEPINIRATLENKSGKDINLFYGASTTDNSVELMPRFEDLIEYPIRGDLCRNDVETIIPFKQGETCTQDFTFQTYTDYFLGTSENGYITVPTEFLPDYNKPAEQGLHNGKLCVKICSDASHPHGTVTEYSLDFSVTLI